MDRIKSKNCGSRAWSEVILSQAKDLEFRWHRLSNLWGIFGTAWKGCATKK